MRAVLKSIRLAFSITLVSLLLLPLLGPPFYLELGGVGAPGSVVAKREVIERMYANWRRQMVVDVRFQPGDTAEPEVAEIAIDEATYDRLSIGTPVQIYYIPHPTLRHLGNLTTARLDSQAPLASFIARGGGLLINMAVGIVLFLLLLCAWNKWRHWSLVLGILALLIGGAFLLGSGLPPAGPTGVQLPGSAMVRETHHITRIWESSRKRGQEAAQPYLIVELSFVPQGAHDPVIAVDTVDIGSVLLERGMTVPISYSAQDPRRAQIVGASRTYYWKNLRGVGMIVLVMVVVLALLWVYARRTLQRRASGSRP